MAAVGVLVLLGIAIKVLTGGSPCTFSCEPHVGPPIPDAHTYTAPSLGISFGYPDGPNDQWTQVPASDVTPGALVAFENRADGGLFEIFAGTGDQNPDSLVQKAVSQVEDNFGLSQMTKMGPIFGAEIGFSPGTGEFYTATGQAQDGSQLPMVVGVVAAEHQGTWATFIGLTPQNQADTYTGMQDGNSFDDVLARWSWPGS